MADDDTVMADLEDKLSAMETSLAKVKSLLSPLLATPLDQLRPKLEPLDRAKLEVSTAFAINSLAFSKLSHPLHMYMCTLRLVSHRPFSRWQTF